MGRGILLAPPRRRLAPSPRSPRAAAPSAILILTVTNSPDPFSYFPPGFPLIFQNEGDALNDDAEQAAGLEEGKRDLILAQLFPAAKEKDGLATRAPP